MSFSATLVALAGLALAVAGCAAPESGQEPGSSLAALSGPRIERGERVFHAPEGADGADAFALRLRWEDGRVEALGYSARAWTERQGYALVVDDEGHLHRLSAREGGLEDATLEGAYLPRLWPAPGGLGVALVRLEGATGSLRLYDGREEQVLAEGLAGAGLVSFRPDARPDGGALVYVGSPPGGVAGLRWVALDGSGRHACLTNCALRTGQPWGGAFVPSPGSAEAIEWGEGELSWTAMDGARHRVSLPEERP